MTATATRKPVHYVPRETMMERRAGKQSTITNRLARFFYDDPKAPLERWQTREEAERDLAQQRRDQAA